MMKKICILIFISSVFIAHNFCQNFNGPESIIYDKTNERFIVSNAEGNYISQINSKWEVSVLVDSCTAPRGLFILDNQLFVAALNSVLIIDLTADSIIKTINIPGAGLLNDLTIDHLGNIYATDSDKHLVYKIDGTTNNITNLIDTQQNLPNGIFYLKKNKNVYIGYSKGDITLAIYDLEGKLLNEKKFNAFVDGIAFNTKGELFFSDWFPVGIYKTQSNLEKHLIAVSAKHNGPADISITEIDNKEYLLVPNYLSNSIDIMHLNDSSASVIRSLK